MHQSPDGNGLLRSVVTGGLLVGMVLAIGLRPTRRVEPPDDARSAELIVVANGEQPVQATDLVPPFSELSAVQTAPALKSPVRIWVADLVREFQKDPVAALKRQDRNSVRVEGCTVLVRTGQRGETIVGLAETYYEPRQPLFLTGLKYPDQVAVAALQDPPPPVAPRIVCLFDADQRAAVATLHPDRRTLIEGRLLGNQHGPITLDHCRVVAQRGDSFTVSEFQLSPDNSDRWPAYAWR